MKVQVVGNTELIDSVNVEIDDDSNQLHICITTRDRWVPHQISGGWGLFSRLCPEGAAPPEHRLIAVGGDEDNNAPGAEVVFLPDHARETELLDGIAYHMTEKEQISYVMLPRKLPRFHRLRQIARWHARPRQT